MMASLRLVLKVGWYRIPIYTIFWKAPLRGFPPEQINSVTGLLQSIPNKFEEGCANYGLADVDLQGLFH